jgi:hypothetical protein
MRRGWQAAIGLALVEIAVSAFLGETMGSCRLASVAPARMP